VASADVDNNHPSGNSDPIVHNTVLTSTVITTICYHHRSCPISAPQWAWDHAQARLWVSHGIVRYKSGETVMPNMAELIITMDEHPGPIDR
jgi:hypothetical protein